MKFSLTRQKQKEEKVSGKMKARHVDATERLFRDWAIMLVTFTLLAIVVVFADSYLFVRVNRGDFLSAEATPHTGALSLNRKMLLDASNFFDARQKEYQAFVSALPAETDPSL